MKEKNNDIPFIKNNFREDDFLKIKSNNKITITESNSINDISLTVQNNDNENNIIL